MPNFKCKPGLAYKLNASLNPEPGRKEKEEKKASTPERFLIVSSVGQKAKRVEELENVSPHQTPPSPPNMHSYNNTRTVKMVESDESLWFTVEMSSAGGC